MSKPPSTYTIHITYSASSSKKPSSHQGQGKSVFSSVLATYNAQYSSTAQCSDHFHLIGNDIQLKHLEKNKKNLYLI